MAIVAVVGSDLAGPLPPEVSCTIELGLGFRLRARSAERVAMTCERELELATGDDPKSLESRQLARPVAALATDVARRERIALRQWEVDFPKCNAPTLSADGCGFWTR